MKIIPPEEFINQYEKDYSEMQENMIYGEKISFKELIEKIISKARNANVAHSAYRNDL